MNYCQTFTYSSIARSYNFYYDILSVQIFLKVIKVSNQASRYKWESKFHYLLQTVGFIIFRTDP